jgi:hypothetical protein
MRTFVRFTLIPAMILTGVSIARAQVSVGIAIGAPPPPRAVYLQPASPHEGAYWVPPHHDREQFFVGYWAGDRGRIEHDHHWDRRRDRDREHDRRRDYHRDRDHDHDRD